MAPHDEDHGHHHHHPHRRRIRDEGVLLEANGATSDQRSETFEVQPGVSGLYIVFEVESGENAEFNPEIRHEQENLDEPGMVRGPTVRGIGRQGWYVGRRPVKADPQFQASSVVIALPSSFLLHVRHGNAEPVSYRVRYVTAWE